MSNLVILVVRGKDVSDFGFSLRYRAEENRHGFDEFEPTELRKAARAKRQAQSGKREARERDGE
jgi:hypothetical protein